MSAETKVLYEFGKFRCDPREHLLLRDGKPVSLSPKSFEILVALIRSNGRLLMKDELMQQVWPDSFVEEANLTVNISALRKVLGEAPRAAIHRDRPQARLSVHRRSCCSRAGFRTT